MFCVGGKRIGGSCLRGRLDIFLLLKSETDDGQDLPAAELLDGVSRSRIQHVESDDEECAEKNIEGDEGGLSMKDLFSV